MRLNRFLALGGIGSRRGVEELILEGHVSINGEICIELSRQVQPGDVVRVGRKIVEALEIITIALNKPAGYVTTRDDEFGRETVYTLLPGRLHHLRHVGRLDAESEGLLLLSNDGDLARNLTAPSAGVSKEYLVTLDQPPTNEQLETFLKGVFLPKGKAWAEEVHRLSPRRIIMVLGQGMKRQIRMMASALGLRVKKLVRTSIGGLTLNELELPAGKWVRLKQEQIDALLKPTPPIKPKKPRKVLPVAAAQELIREKSPATRKRVTGTRRPTTEKNRSNRSRPGKNAPRSQKPRGTSPAKKGRGPSAGGNRPRRN